MVEGASKPCLVIWVCHGQRADHVKGPEDEKEEDGVFEADSPLTEAGIM